MNIAAEYIALAESIADSIPIPEITGIHLPKVVEDAEKPDEFGFVFLKDGSAGPFYTSLDDTLQQLWSRYPDAKSCTADTLGMINNISSESPALRALALGAFNALSQHVMRCANYFATETVKDADTDYASPVRGETVGMVGYFLPLIDKYLERGIRVLVLEKNPGRVESRKGVSLSTDLSDLGGCRHILCTASTLINGTLSDILETCKNSTSFSLVGPSASGLPDVLLNHGVDIVAGIQFHDMDALHQALDAQESWGHAGKKYQITANNYPGVLSLLEKIKDQNKI